VTKLDFAGISVGGADVVVVVVAVDLQQELRKWTQYTDGRDEIPRVFGRWARDDGCGGNGAEYQRPKARRRTHDVAG